MLSPEPRILYESPELLAVDKAPGVVVIPARGTDRGCLRHTLEASRGESLWVVHRIDRDTSGVVVFARSAEAHRTLSKAFERHEVHKTYVALTRGAPARESGSIDVSLHTARKGKMRPALAGEPDALTAHTGYVVRRRWETPAGTVCMIEATPTTGRQHQVRVHLRWAGAPLLVDPIYGRSHRVEAHELGISVNLSALDRLTLHAAVLDLPSLTEDNVRVILRAQVPQDLAAWTAALEARGAPALR